MADVAGMVKGDGCFVHGRVVGGLGGGLRRWEGG
jgi:hypothetical protein